MRCPCLLLGVIWLNCAAPARTDELLYSYDGDVPPYPDAGWWWSNCEDTCHESLEDGHLVLRWDSGRIVSYGYIIATSQSRPPPPDPPFWVEWRFRSNHVLRNNPYCDGRVSIQYLGFHDVILMFGDAVVSFDGGTVRGGLPEDAFRTYRFESTDGLLGCVFVDGSIFKCKSGGGGTGTSAVQMVGLGGCDLTQPPTVNEWDFVRFGTITYGEQIIASDPPEGFLDARIHAPLDRFTITFDEPNYVMVDEITVEATEPQSHEATKGNRTATARERSHRAMELQSHEATKNQSVHHLPPYQGGTQGGSIDIASASFSIQHSALDLPTVMATGRRDNGPPDEVEIVLDRPLPYNATTRFVFDDGEAINIVEFTFAPGDVDGDGQATLADFAWLQNCFGGYLEANGNRTINAFAPSMNDSDPPFGILDSPFAIPLGPCLVLDHDADGLIDLDDHASFLVHLAGP